MTSPRPPPPAIAASVAVATTYTAPVRMPANISGIASGISTFHSTWLGLMPTARAASTASGSTPSTAT